MLSPSEVAAIAFGITVFIYCTLKTCIYYNGNNHIARVTFSNLDHVSRIV